MPLGRSGVTMAESWRSRLFAVLWLLAGAAITAAVITSPELRRLVVQAAHVVRPNAVLATLPGQFIASAMCAGALFALHPGVSFKSCVASRILRDAGGNLLVIMPGLGEAIGARALVLAGGGTRAAITASALDVIAEGIAQIPYGILAVVVLPQLLSHAGLGFAADLPMGWIAAGLAAAGLLAAQLARNPAGLVRRLIVQLMTELALLRAQIKAHQRGLPLSISLHLLAWAMGGVQLWAAGWVLGLHLGLFAAIVMESAAYAARAILFFVPAGLAVQETGLLVTGLAFGLSPAQALALALILRIRDVLFGLPLLLWPLFEYRHRAAR